MGSKSGNAGPSSKGALSVAFLLCFLCAIVVVPSVKAQECIRRDLTHQPSLIGSAVWMPASQQLIAADLGESREASGQLIVYSPDGEEQRVVPGQQKPFFGARLAGKYIQISNRSGESKLNWLDEGFKKQEVSPLSLTTKGSSGYQIQSLYDVSIVEGQLLAYGTFSQNGVPSNGFFRSTLPSSSNKKLTPKMHPVMYFGEDDYYALGNPYITSLGTVAFFFTMHGHAELWSYDMRSGKELPRYMRGFSRKLPPLNSLTRDVFQEIRKHSLPAGLYAQGSYLYVLNQKPSTGSSLSWSLTRLRPDLEYDSVEQAGKVQIDSKATRLIVVPAQENWYFFERLESDNGTEKFSSLLIAPTELIRSANTLSCVSLGK